MSDAKDQPERKDECLRGPRAYPGQWMPRRFEQSCGKVYRWDEREIDGKRESRRVFVRRL